MKDVISGLVSFQPEKLRTVRELVVEQHPGTATRPSTASSSRLQELKERVREAAGDESALERLASELKPMELRGVARSLGDWSDLRPAVVTMIEARPRPSMVPVLWSTWHRRPSVGEVRAILRKFVERFGWRDVVDGDWEDTVSRWLNADSPPLAVQRWMDGQGLSYTDLGDVSGFPIPSGAPLHKKIRDAVMTDGSSRQLRQEETERLLEWFGHLDPDDMMAFGRNYLESINSGRWDGPVLELLEGEYGLPKATDRSVFWSEVSEPSRKAFQKFFIERKIEDIFGRGTDRDQYWKGWGGELVEVSTGKAGRTRYGVLNFGGFVAVEFFKVGNAAYFYTDRQWEQIDASNPSHPSDLKEKHYGAPGPGKDNRLIHHGSWESTADRNVRSWIRSTG